MILSITQEYWHYLKFNLSLFMSKIHINYQFFFWVISNNLQNDRKYGWMSSFIKYALYKFKRYLKYNIRFISSSLILLS